MTSVGQADSVLGCLIFNLISLGLNIFILKIL